MSGQSAIRGFLLQTLVCLLDAVSNNNDWTEITLEPNVLSEKVDILIKYSNVTKVTQVKSSQNQISISNATNWANELKVSAKADTYELLLLGPTSQSVIENPIINGVIIPTPKVIDLTTLIEQASHKLDKYLSKKGFLPIPPFIREEFIRSLITNLSIYSTNGSPISRNDFDKLIQDWIMNIYPASIIESISMQCDMLLDTIVLIGGQGPEIPIILPITFINEGNRTAIIEWISFKVFNETNTFLYTPVILVDYTKFIQGRKGLHSDNILGNFSQFAVSPHNTKELAISFSQELDNPNYKPKSWTPGNYEFNVYVKFRDNELPKLLAKLKDVKLTTKQIDENRNGASAAIMIRNINLN